MEDSAKGIIISFTIIFIFALSMVNFVIMFPSEQGFELTQIDNISYAKLSQASGESTGIINQFNSTENTLNEGFSQWDIEVGYMGSNTQKASKSSISTYGNKVLDMIQVIIYEVFSTTDGSVHPIVTIFSIMLGLFSIYVLINFIKFIRTGY